MECLRTEKHVFTSIDTNGSCIHCGLPISAARHVSIEEFRAMEFAYKKAARATVTKLTRSLKMTEKNRLKELKYYIRYLKKEYRV